MIKDMGYYYILDADNEEPKCFRCDNCLSGYDCNECGAEYGWAGYQRTVSKKEYWKEETQNGTSEN